jgi:hypothetical protein
VTDADRERAVRELSRHCGDGRLTLDELDERISEVYAASTKSQLEHAVRELPRTAVHIPSSPPVRVQPSAAPVRVSAKKGAEVALKVHTVVYLSVIGFLVMIWFLTSPFGYFWPIWPAMGWGLALAIQAGVTKVGGGGDC